MGCYRMVPPVRLIVAETAQGRAILGVVDESKPQDVEDQAGITWRTQFLRQIGYKLACRVEVKRAGSKAARDMGLLPVLIRSAIQRVLMVLRSMPLRKCPATI